MFLNALALRANVTLTGLYQISNPGIGASGDVLGFKIIKCFKLMLRLTHFTSHVNRVENGNIAFEWPCYKELRYKKIETENHMQLIACGLPNLFK